MEFEAVHHFVISVFKRESVWDPLHTNVHGKMSSSSSECKQGWMPQFSSSACTLWWSLTKMCAKCFTPSLFIAKTRKVTLWLSEGRLPLQPFPFTSLPGGLSCSGWLSDFQWLLQQNLFSRRASKPTQAFLLHGERHKHQIISFLSRNMQMHQNLIAFNYSFFSCLFFNSGSGLVCSSLDGICGGFLWKVNKSGE